MISRHGSRIDNLFSLCDLSQHAALSHADDLHFTASLMLDIRQCPRFICIWIRPPRQTRDSIKVISTAYFNLPTLSPAIPTLSLITLHFMSSTHFANEVETASRPLQVARTSVYEHIEDSVMYSATPGYPPWQSNGHYIQPQNAYTAVPARQTFAPGTLPPPPPTYHPPPFGAQAPPPPPPLAQAAAPSPAKKQWSPAIRDYVSRSFAQENAISEVSKPELEVRLRSIITDMAASGRLDTIDWPNYPLPQQIIMEERTRATTTPFVVASNSISNQSSYPNTSGHRFPSTTPNRKRKSNDMSDELDVQTTQPPWQKNSKPSSGLADRVSFAPVDKRQKMEEPKAMSKLNLEARKKRFDAGRSGYASPTTPHTPHGNSPEPEQVGPIVGRSQKLEKNYFRLTSAPNPDDVRPLPILKQTLELLKKKWRSESNYVYICDQFKSLRQDLTVQHIKNDFTTMVYEIHARIALEKGDLGEYNQCQTQLRALYKLGLGGRPVEFKAYRILYFIHTCNRTDMNDVLSELTPADKKEDAIKHALDVRSALALGNYHKFFQLYLKVPNMGAYLMDMFVERERLAALARMCKT
jgi:SAC3 family protein LENG8/THP3